MNIGSASKQSSIPSKTIRYYEDVGLIKPLRDTNGYRDFNEQDVHKLNFLGRARALGFTIEDCRGLLGLWEDHSRASADVKEIARGHLSLIDAKIKDLSGMRDTLSHLVDTCNGDERPGCPIIEKLAGNGL
ncbi:Cu(I)-responsive transcriptional regulator [Granulosicoccus antarcticus]|uniref:HTH-type transcriptional regulator HmrR n=1 Tax=Granulosicoccus antarcticus IMCC3135 TaxID=1192854 RepID=A0A2Z2NZK6_9GAMM|nr:Cu(I)-responsive transcriptional regulator [Granulosicoccus antarcticus]ASJ76866.1 HTH-type transcriptional regulator HmrR [Granulosicoccus antarcticus IMCC3135]